MIGSAGHRLCGAQRYAAGALSAAYGQHEFMDAMPASGADSRMQSVRDESDAGLSRGGASPALASRHCDGDEGSPSLSGGESSYHLLPGGWVRRSVSSLQTSPAFGTPPLEAGRFPEFNDCGVPRRCGRASALRARPIASDPHGLPIDHQSREQSLHRGVEQLPTVGMKFYFWASLSILEIAHHHPQKFAVAALPARNPASAFATALARGLCSSRFEHREEPWTKSATRSVDQ